jgi:hypothetical protein
LRWGLTNFLPGLPWGHDPPDLSNLISASCSWMRFQAGSPVPSYWLRRNLTLPSKCKSPSSSLSTIEKIK